jgi:CRP/FNR family cyclic AMP-dependent transcriptional regulator
MPEQEFVSGHVFFRPGEAGDRAYLVNAGEVELLTGAEGSTSRVTLLRPGDVFGEMALIEERPRALTARAVTAGRVTPMTRDEFEHLLTHDPARTRQYLRSLFERIRGLTARLGEGVEPAAAVQSAVPTPAELPQGQGRLADWVVVLHPITRRSAQTLPDDGLLVTRFPLRIGRTTGVNEREALDLNDVWLLDEQPYTISRNHCEIDVGRDGPLVRDRGSHLGCVVNDERIGGRTAVGFAPLEVGSNVVIIGGRMSPYQFRVEVRPA